MLKTESSIVFSKVDTGEDHITCCDDENLSLCNLDLSDTPWGPIVKPCGVCDRRYIDRICPKGKICDAESDYEGN
jgi:hypothetical protein